MFAVRQMGHECPIQTGLSKEVALVLAGLLNAMGRDCGYRYAVVRVQA